ncbi:MAG: DNA-directed RNA polymerase subunit omega [Spirochaetaceae bacterium]|jgi:DNA-directed RNA polymerase subunit omega|nr:DNA-directed RNA polymerase subunit omega [Spirochaetaceae bacterium]
MIFPLEELIKYEKSMYEITCASSKRAYQLSMLKLPEIDETGGKVVSIAARQIFTGEVEFRLSPEGDTSGSLIPSLNAQ